MPDPADPTFTLTIRLGNDAMQTAEDVALALRETADYIDGTGGWEHIYAGRVRDANGNTVGDWEVLQAHVMSNERGSGYRRLMEQAELPELRIDAIRKHAPRIEQRAQWYNELRAAALTDDDPVLEERARRVLDSLLSYIQLGSVTDRLDS